MIIAWLHSVQTRADKQLQGRSVWAYMLPILLCLMYALERIALSSQSYSLDMIIRFIADSKYYANPLLFEVWQLWSYILYHDDIVQLLLIAVFSFPVLAYWERHFGQSYILVAMIILMPACIAFYMLIGLSSEQPGFSLVVPALYGGLVFQGGALYARCTLVTLWGSRLGLRHPNCRLHWPLLMFVLFEALRLYYVSADYTLPLIFLGSSIIAMCIGSSVFTVLSMLKGGGVKMP